MEAIRQPAVAGTFYPKDPGTLAAMIASYLQPSNAPLEATCPKALIVPHAGYIYSGPVAAQAYTLVRAAAANISRVVLLGPSHRVAFRGMAMPSSTSFHTPLGDIPIDVAALNTIVDLPSVGFLDQAHAQEHSLEVHLPFLQTVLGEFSLVPIVVGEASKEDVARVLDRLWGGPETLIVISSDLSHFESYEIARTIDRRTSNKILSMETGLTGNEACGCRPINGLLHYLKAQNLKTQNPTLRIEEIDVRNSGDTAGDKSRVVGYGAYRIMEEEPMNTRIDPEWTLSQRQRLLQVAREAIRSPLEGEKNYHLNLERFPAPFALQRATFVTLNINGRLRGCIGSLIAHRSLVADVAHNAQAAAFKDPRFSPLTHDEYQQVDVHISVLSVPVQMNVSSLADLVQQIRPGIDGLIIKESGAQATYLPSVWAQLPDAATFVAELRAKAGLAKTGWSDTTEVFRYTTEEFC